MTKQIIAFRRATLKEASECRSTTLLVAVSEILSVKEFAPKSTMLPDGMSVVKLKKGSDEHPVLGTPDDIYEQIKAFENGK